MAIAITWEQVAAMDPAFVGVPEAARSVVVSRANDLPADVWNSEAQEQLARIYQAAHDATVILQTMATTSGVPVISATLGPASETYGVQLLHQGEQLDKTAWGRLLKQLMDGTVGLRLAGI